ncbi:PDZ domain-containing protein [Streptomyces sp. NPDC004065]|uniref:PDZ domain-containing protein n=1 Tax=Streptomyces sp. NPDC004065 TaxID=3364689 RepID=UPI00384ED508
MEQTALRPKPMPGQAPGGAVADGTRRRPHAARRRGRRLVTLLLGLLAGLGLVLSGVGLGAFGATVIGVGGRAEPRGTAGVQRAWEPRPGPARTPSDGAPALVSAPVRPTLGVEAVDAGGGPGARVVGVHVPGPGYSAGLVRGDVLLTFGGARVGSAADLARAVARARPGRPVPVTVRHRGGGLGRLAVTPGVMV